MTDMDFEEIDKAVSSAMGSGPDDSKDQAVPVTVSARSSVATSERSPAPAAKRSAGRFMDVMHSSSDMKSTQRPSGTPAKPDYTFPSGAVETPKPEITDAVADVDEIDDSQPLSTPFLTDTKVDKRPLGAYSDTVKDEPAEEMASPTEDNLSKDNFQTPLPAELGDDLLAIESKQIPSETPVSGQTVSEPKLADQLAVETSEQAMPAPAPAEIPNDEPEPPVPSIVQQYKEQPSSATQTSGAIFDTEQYHTPLAHTPKKHTGWLVVIWILALIIIGAGLGAAAYYFVLPGLL